MRVLSCASHREPTNGTQRVPMSTIAKFLVGLALILPMTGYVVGSLISTSAGEPDRREPVIVNDVRSPSPDGPASTPPSGQGGGTGRGQPDPPPGGGDDGTDDTNDADDRDVDQNGITVVRPEPTRPDNADGSRNGDDDRDDDRDDDTDDSDNADGDGDGDGDD